MFDNITPGQKITVSVTAVPRRMDQVQTIERLMRQSVDARRGLARAQRRRARFTPVKIRGGRRWFVRETPAKIVRVESGASWEMSYAPLMNNDFSSVASFLKVKPA